MVPIPDVVPRVPVMPFVTDDSCRSFVRESEIARFGFASQRLQGSITKVYLGICGLCNMLVLGLTDLGRQEAIAHQGIFSLLA